MVGPFSHGFFMQSGAFDMAKLKRYLRSKTTSVRNDMLQNPRLSLKAKGFLCLLLSFPDNWEYKRDHILTMMQESRRVWEGCIKELIYAGYLARHKVNGEDGRFTYDYLVSDIPIPMNDADRFTKTGRL
jgi:hypothetical protein